MLCKRIIPTLLYRGETLVKGSQFNSWRSVGHIQQAARIYAQRGVDELIILDIGATKEGRGPNFQLVSKICEGNFCPITVGGGVRTVQDVTNLLKAGADKVSIGTATHILPECRDRFGSQALVASIDYFQKDWRTVVGKARDCQWLGCGEILLTCRDFEGRMHSYDLPLLRMVCEAVDVPVIAHGGCGTYQNMLEAFEAGASGAAAGSMFQFTDSTPKGAAQFLKQQGLEVRCD